MAASKTLRTIKTQLMSLTATAPAVPTTPNLPSLMPTPAPAPAPTPAPAAVPTLDLAALVTAEVQKALAAATAAHQAEIAALKAQLATKAPEKPTVVAWKIEGEEKRGNNMLLRWAAVGADGKTLRRFSMGARKLGVFLAMTDDGLKALRTAMAHPVVGEFVDAYEAQIEAALSICKADKATVTAWVKANATATK